MLYRRKQINLSAAIVDDRRLDRLRWKARRGLLENDLLLSQFLDAQLTSLSDGELDVLDQLLQLGDNDLLDILMGRKLCGDQTWQPMADRIVATSVGKLNSLSGTSSGKHAA